jgi:hypothetical protein
MLDRAKRGFDETMELLASLPKAPCAATLADLAGDFGYSTQEGVRRLLLLIRSRLGIKTRVFRSKHHQYVVELPPNQWAKADELALAYWRNVHESSAASAA